MKLHRLFESIKELPDEDKFGPQCTTPDCSEGAIFIADVYNCFMPQCYEHLLEEARKDKSHGAAAAVIRYNKIVDPEMATIIRMHGPSGPTSYYYGDQKDLDNLIKRYGRGPRPVREGIEDLPDRDEFGIRRVGDMDIGEEGYLFELWLHNDNGWKVVEEAELEEGIVNIANLFNNSIAPDYAHIKKTSENECTITIKREASDRGDKAPNKPGVYKTQIVPTARPEDIEVFDYVPPDN